MFKFHMIQDVSPGVRKSALHGLNNTLSTVKNLKPSDANTFPEYIFPGLINVSIKLHCLIEFYIYFKILGFTR